jgi:hypothetical protein
MIQRRPHPNGSIELGEWPTGGIPRLFMTSYALQQAMQAKFAGEAPTRGLS